MITRLTRRPAARARLHALTCMALLCAVSGCARPAPHPGAGAAQDREASVKPGINDEYRDADVPKWQGRFETEGREVYRARHEIVAALGLAGGERLADIGAGTGLFTLLLARAVGPDGSVYAVDIVPEFLEHIRDRASAERVSNVQTWGRATERSAALPPASLDVVFICDTYHHFEYPVSMLDSLRAALRPGGRLVVVDFERIPGVSREWVLNHVRAGKPEVIAEITAAGFELEREVPIPRMTENYMLVFRLPASAR